jgi:uncharacterized protein YdhG (YjbR/CyaY superfamily)
MVKEPMPGPPKSIDDYLKTVETSRRSALQKLRKQILAVVPEAEECISYSMPAFRLPEGQVVAGFLATNKGCSYFPFSGTTLDNMAGDLKGYGRTKSGLHFDPKTGLPSTLVRKLLANRRAEIATYPKTKKTKKKTKTKPVKKTAAKKATKRRRGLS